MQRALDKTVLEPTICKQSESMGAHVIGRVDLSIQEIESQFLRPNLICVHSVAWQFVKAT